VAVVFFSEALLPDPGAARARIGDPGADFGITTAATSSINRRFADPKTMILKRKDGKSGHIQQLEAPQQHFPGDNPALDQRLFKVKKFSPPTLKIWTH
jgi:hypothetical protein